MDQGWISHEVRSEEEGRKVESILRGTMGISRRMLQKLTRSDGFTLNGKKTFLDRRVKAGDVLRVRIQTKEEPSLPPFEMPLDILYEDDDLLILNKGAGVEVHPSEQRPLFRPTLAHGVAHYFQTKGIEAKIRPLHRLDKDTSGLVIFTKNAFSHHALDKQLHARRLSRKYLALVRGVPSPPVDIIREPIAREPGHPLRRRVDPAGDPAVTHYRLEEAFGHWAALLSLELETGRTHQIRVHVSHRGHPIIGDVLYDPDLDKAIAHLPAPPIGRQALHAYAMELALPRTGEPLRVETPLPEDMRSLLEHLRTITQKG